MNIVNKYRQLLSTVLLLLYVFVTTPVQWLHYHESDIVTEKQLAKSDGKLVSSDDDSDLGPENCPICLHKYSSYNNDFFHPQIQSIELQSPVISECIESTLHSNSRAYDNKGPPLVS